MFIDNIASIYCIGIDVWKYWGYVLRIFDSIFYGRSVIVNDTYYMCTKMGGGTHSARRYRRRVKFVLPYCLYAYVYLYLMRRDVARRYKQRNHIQQ